MSKVRIYTLAKELNLENARMLEILDGLGVSYKSVSSTIEEDTVELIKQIVAEEGTGGANGEPQAAAPTEAEKAPEQEAPKQGAASQAPSPPPPAHLRPRLQAPPRPPRPAMTS